MAVHPFILSVLEKVAARPTLWSGTPEQGRAVVAAGRLALGAGPQMLATRELQVTMRSGAAIPARLHVPSSCPAGLIVYAHGGGWVLGSMDDYDALARTLALKSNCAVLLPEYRLAPEFKFPVPLEDVCDVIVWASSVHQALLGRKTPLLVAGDSAGANLAAVAARRLRETVDISAQILLYPVTDHDVSTPSYSAYAEGYTLSARDMRWFFDHYADAGKRDDPDISPLRADDLVGLPQALVMTAEFDVLKDEGRAYAERLTAAGVAVAYTEIKGMTHGFIRFHNLLDVADHAVQTIASYALDICNAQTPQTGDT